MTNGIFYCTIFGFQSGWGMGLSKDSIDKWDPWADVVVMGGFPAHLFAGPQVAVDGLLSAAVSQCIQTIPGISLDVRPNARFMVSEGESSHHLAVEVSYSEKAYKAWKKSLK